MPHLREVALHQIAVGNDDVKVAELRLVEAEALDHTKRQSLVDARKHLKHCIVPSATSVCGMSTNKCRRDSGDEINWHNCTNANGAK